MKFFADYEFTAPSGALYWFPHYVEASSMEDARDYFDRIATGIKQNYTLLRRSNPTPVIQGLNASRIAEYRNRKAIGKPHLLNIHHWTMSSVNVPADIPFERATDMEVEALLGKNLIQQLDGPLATATGMTVSVREFAPGRFSSEEFILINVVLP